MKPTSAQLARLHILYKQLGIDTDAKKAMLMEYTEGRTDSSAGLRQKEADALILSLAADAAAADPCDKMRKKIISRAHRLGWVLNPAAYEGKQKVDMNRLNAWCVKYGHLHKELSDYGYNDLVKLNSQMDMAYASYLKSV